MPLLVAHSVELQTLHLGFVPSGNSCAALTHRVRCQEGDYLTMGFYEKARQMLVMRGGPGSIKYINPVRIFHGMRDTIVPPAISRELVEKLASEDVHITLVCASSWPTLGPGSINFHNHCFAHPCTSWSCSISCPPLEWQVYMIWSRYINARWQINAGLWAYFCYHHYITTHPSTGAILKVPMVQTGTMLTRLKSTESGGGKHWDLSSGQ